MYISHPHPLIELHPCPGRRTEGERDGRWRHNGRHRPRQRHLRGGRQENRSRKQPLGPPPRVSSPRWPVSSTSSTPTQKPSLPQPRSHSSRRFPRTGMSTSATSSRRPWRRSAIRAADEIKITEGMWFDRELISPYFIADVKSYPTDKHLGELAGAFIFPTHFPPRCNAVRFLSEWIRMICDYRIGYCSRQNSRPHGENVRLSATSGSEIRTAASDKNHRFGKVIWMQADAGWRGWLRWSHGQHIERQWAFRTYPGANWCAVVW